MQSDVLSGGQRLLHQCSSMLRKLWNRYKNILKRVQLSSKCYRIKLLECVNFGAIESNGHVSKTILVHLEPGAIPSGSDYYNVDVK